MTLYAVVRGAEDDKILASCHTRCSVYSFEAEDFWSFGLDLKLHVKQTDVWKSLSPVDIRWKLDTILELYILTSHGYKSIRRKMTGSPNRQEQFCSHVEETVDNLMILQYNDCIYFNVTDIASSTGDDNHPWDSILKYRLVLDSLIDEETVDDTNQCVEKNRLVEFMTSIGLAPDA